MRNLGYDFDFTDTNTMSDDWEDLWRIDFTGIEHDDQLALTAVMSDRLMNLAVGVLDSSGSTVSFSQDVYSYNQEIFNPGRGITALTPLLTGDEDFFAAVSSVDPYKKINYTEYELYVQRIPGGLESLGKDEGEPNNSIADAMTLSAFPLAIRGIAEIDDTGSISTADGENMEDCYRLMLGTAHVQIALLPVDDAAVDLVVYYDNEEIERLPGSYYIPDGRGIPEFFTLDPRPDFNSCLVCVSVADSSDTDAPYTLLMLDLSQARKSISGADSE